MEEAKLGLAISHVLKAIIFLMGVWSAYKHDWQWAFGCFFAFLLAMSPLFIKRSYHISLPWIMELLIVVAFSFHVWGGVLHLYSLVYYDKIAHFSVSAIVAFFALTIIYLLDVYWEGLHMDIFMVGFFISIFTIAMGTIWEIVEFASDQIFSHGIPVAQISLQDTMTDLIADSLAGIIVGVTGALSIRRGELKDIIHPLDREMEKISNRSFLQAKEKAMETLKKAMENNEVDKKAIPIIEKLNGIDEFFTTSSCSGRIAIMELPSIGNKIDARFLGKWDDKIKIQDIKNALENAEKGEIWMLAQPPIFHVSASDVNAASKLIKVAKQSGFKNSGIRSIGKRVTVEVRSTEEVDVPLGIDGKLLCDEKYLSLLVSIANEIMDRIEKKLKVFERKIEELG
ncbi:MAG TPA: hypothetical protein ENF91_03060 [Thermoplasmatales archaeon]|nr:MAG: hypothetical protein DRN10_00915 [Thermoplasmata archaeon]HDH82052.1 hypothetical protein [Thermoplasmatales archaeon]